MNGGAEWIPGTDALVCSARKGRAGFLRTGHGGPFHTLEPLGCVPSSGASQVPRVGVSANLLASSQWANVLFCSVELRIG